MKKEMLRTKPVSNPAFYWIGLSILALNKIRHSLTGYRRPRNFSAKEIQKAIDYDLQVTGIYEEALKDYLNSPAPLKNKTILELGPGPDLGNGLILCAMGAKYYHAIDILPLVQQTGEEFYKQLATQLQRLDLIEEIKKAIEFTVPNPSADRKVITYTVNKHFDLSPFSKKKIDLVVSHVAFEHFNDVEKTIRQIGALLPSGGIFLADIDLQTHTRWIRDKDPLNIYRYSSGLYRIFKFLGSPNRRRPNDYKEALRQAGFSKIKVIPRVVVSSAYVEATKKGLARPFADDPDLAIMDFVLLATKK